MKTLFKAIVLCCLLYSGKISAQSGPVECKILYGYDGAGNRIKREYKCAPTWTIYDPVNQQDYTIFTSLFPNPTSGVITAVFSEPLSAASFLIYAANGSIIQSYNLTQQSTMVTFDLSAQVPGTYFLTVWALNKEETYTIIKM